MHGYISYPGGRMVEFKMIIPDVCVLAIASYVLLICSCRKIKNVCMCCIILDSNQGPISLAN